MKHTMTKKLKALSRKVLKISKPYYHNQLFCQYYYAKYDQSFLIAKLVFIFSIYICPIDNECLSCRNNAMGKTLVLPFHEYN